MTDLTTDHGSADRCAALKLELAQVDDQMRAGYTAREAARLWDRWRNLKERLQHERC